MSDAFAFRNYWVVADVTDHKFYSGKGTHYFCLAEKNPVTHALSAKLSAVAWSDGGAVAIASFQRITGQSFKSNIRVLVNVSVSYHQLYGLQLVLNDIDASFTIGQLEQQRLDVLERLVKEHAGHVRRAGGRYITTNNSLDIARVVQKVAVVTSSSAAGYIDFKNTLETNRHRYKIHLTPYFTIVQGEANAGGLCRTLEQVKESGIQYDAVVIIRGGGAQTDLLLFNQYDVAAMIASFPIPVISGIGHQINETITDLMAHTSVKTPSIAAEAILSHNREFEDELKGFQQTIIVRSQQLISSKQQQLSRVNSVLVNEAKAIIQGHKDRLSGVAVKLTTKPLIILGKQRNELDNAVNNLRASNSKYIVVKNKDLDHIQAMIRLMSPESVLKRGFAIVYQNERIATDPNQLKQHDNITKDQTKD